MRKTPGGLAGSFPGPGAEAMNGSRGHDVRQTLEYRTATAIVRLLPTGLLLIFLGLFIFALADPDREAVGRSSGSCFVW